MDVPVCGGNSAYFIFYPKVLEGDGIKILTVRSAEEIVCGNGYCRIRPQFKKMFWRMFKVMPKDASFPAVREIIVFNGSAAVELSNAALWYEVCSELVETLEHGLYPGRKAEVLGLGL